jgi:hypothetical protein
MAGALLLGWAVALQAAPTATAAEPDATPTPAATLAPSTLPDLGPVVIAAADLPDGFGPSDANVRTFTALAHSLAGTLPDSPDAEDHNTVVLERRTEAGSEFVTAVLIGPLSDDDQAAFDATVQQMDRVVEDAVAGAMGDADVEIIEGMRTGISRFAVAIRNPDLGVEYRALVARRGPVLLSVGHAWTAGVEPVTSLADVAATLDARLAAAVGPEAPVYRPPGPLVPVITTHIPTPLDVSTDPAVVGTNLVLAAIALLLLTISSKAATGLLAEHEGALAAHVPLAGGMGRAKGRVARAVGGRIHGRRARDVLALLAVTWFYGFVFSLLEPGWEPLTLTGIWLLVSFTVANGLVGLGDDLVAWVVARRWGAAASLAVRPTTVLLAAASVGVSRVAAVVPGLMFGTPEALRLGEGELDPGRMRRLAAIGLVALVAVGGIAWAITMATTSMARNGEMTNGLAGIEALLLLVFASALQNLFVALLGFRGSAGELLRQRSRVAWLAATTVVTFLFFHTLLNPQGDPSTALTNRNVQVTLGLVLAFSIGTGVAWVIARLAAPRDRPAGSQAGDDRGPSVPAWAPPGGAAPGGPPPGGPPPGGPTSILVPAAAGVSAAVPADPAVFSPAAPGPVREPGDWCSIGTADAAARGRLWLGVADGMVVARSELLDPAARRQFQALVVLSAMGLFIPVLAGVVALDRRPASEGMVIGLLGLLGAWLLVVIGGRVWLERYRVAHVAVFPAREVVAVDVGRDLGLGCVLTILLSPLVGLLYLALTGGRVTRITAPFDPASRTPIRLRCKGSEAEAWMVQRLLLGSPTRLGPAGDRPPWAAG